MQDVMKSAKQIFGHAGSFQVASTQSSNAQ
jgi:hypothetical protein